MCSMNRTVVFGLLVAMWGAATDTQQSTKSLDLTVLPIPEPARPLYSKR